MRGRERARARKCMCLWKKEPWLVTRWSNGKPVWCCNWCLSCEPLKLHKGTKQRPLFCNVVNYFSFGFGGVVMLLISKPRVVKSHPCCYSFARTHTHMHLHAHTHIYNMLSFAAKWDFEGMQSWGSHVYGWAYRSKVGLAN